MSHSDGPPSPLESLQLRVEDLEARLERDATSPETYVGGVFDSMFEGIQILDFDFRYVYLNQTAASHGQRSREELIGRRMTEVYPGIDETPLFDLLRCSMCERTPGQMVNCFTYPDGRSAWFDLRIDPVPMGILILSVDVSAHKEAEEQLRRSRQDLAATLECMADGLIATDVAGRVTRMNQAAEDLTGWPEQEARGRPLDELIGFLNQATQSPVEHVAERVLREGIRFGLANDTLLVTRGGARFPVATSGAPIRDEKGDLRGVVLVLRNMKEEYELTAALQRAQKMEALGTLAGGVAHDFNNLLTVISSYTDLLLDELPFADPFRVAIEQIRDAGDRAAALTRQLLAFGRRQMFQPRIVDLNAIVSDADKMLRRLIGEDIIPTVLLDRRLARIKADPGQLEQVIVNLAVNARDAMPDGGKLTIETANVELDEPYAHAHFEAQPGRYVMLAVSDTGCGMDQTTQARIFEPFFTTKPQGKGTGLGLATVFGIVRQSGGHICVYSEPGQGSTFKVYLPAIADRSVRPRPSPAQTAEGGHETILLVEDEEPVRAVTVLGLRKFGYEVLEAASGREAIRLCEEHPGPLHMLVSDVVMPEMGGKQVAAEILARRPGVKVLFLSGYPDGAILHHGVLERDVAFLQKPFTPSALARKIRQVLGSQA